MCVCACVRVCMCVCVVGRSAEREMRWWGNVASTCLEPVIQYLFSAY